MSSCQYVFLCFPSIPLLSSFELSYILLSIDWKVSILFSILVKLRAFSRIMESSTMNWHVEYWSLINFLKSFKFLYARISILSTCSELQKKPDKTMTVMQEKHFHTITIYRITVLLKFRFIYFPERKLANSISQSIDCNCPTVTWSLLLFVPSDKTILYVTKFKLVTIKNNEW